MTKEEIQEVIKSRKNYLMNNDMAGFYSDLYHDKSFHNPSTFEITEWFFNHKINPLDYMDYVPECFLAYSPNVKSFTVPENIKEIKNAAFYDSSIKSIKILGQVEKIGKLSFAFCEGLKSIQLPNSLEYIDSDAFTYCKNLKDINIPKSLKKVDKESFSKCSEEIEEKFKGFIK